VTDGLATPKNLGINTYSLRFDLDFSTDPALSSLIEMGDRLKDLVLDYIILLRQQLKHLW